jgi:hypothetical protein
MNLELALEYSFNNRQLLDESDSCACYHCCRLFKPNQIEIWIDGGYTAICPFCGIDAVLGSKAGYSFEPKVLAALKKRWF